MKNILLIITGSIAAFKSLEVIRAFVKSGFKVQVVLSSGGEEFITPLSAAALSGHAVLTKDTFKMEHISFARQADLILICPASASFINKASMGFGGELALDLLLAKTPDTPCILAPAMNVQMWESESVQNSLKILTERGYEVLEPASGKLLCEEDGKGKLPEASFIFASALDSLERSQSLQGKKFLITNGATVEKIDDARFISNFSSGMQGALIAKEILLRGGEVFMLQGRTSNSVRLPSKNLNLFNTLSAKNMHEKALELSVKHKFHAFIAVAAVCDFSPKYTSGKSPKTSLKKLELTQNPDILSEISHLQKNRPTLVIGFAAEEEENLEKNGRLKLKKKGCDILFVNALCFESEETKGIILTEKKAQKFQGKKDELAKTIINFYKF